jgi:hypothetical protein
MQLLLFGPVYGGKKKVVACVCVFSVLTACYLIVSFCILIMLNWKLHGIMAVITNVIICAVLKYFKDALAWFVTFKIKKI